MKSEADSALVRPSDDYIPDNTLIAASLEILSHNPSRKPHPDSNLQKL